MPLTDRERQMLTMAGTQYRYQGARESDVRVLFNLTPTAFYQQVNQLLEREEALSWNPILVKRLRAQRQSRRPRPRATSESVGHFPGRSYLDSAHA